MANTAHIQRRLAALENRQPKEDNRVTRIVRQIINPDGTHGETLVREIGKGGYKVQAA